MLRPGQPDFTCSTPQSAELIKTIGGGGSLDGVKVTTDEMRSLFRLYEYQSEEHADRSQRIFSAAGNTLHCLRRARTDGLRVIAMVAKFCEPGDDPARWLADLMQRAGIDVSTGWEGDDDR